MATTQRSQAASSLVLMSSDPDIAFWMKHSGADTHTGWLQGAVVQTGAGISRTNYSASRGAGANNITWNNTMTRHENVFDNTNWVNVGTGANE
jgi:hypothetical protein